VAVAVGVGSRVGDGSSVGVSDVVGSGMGVIVAVGSAVEVTDGSGSDVAVAVGSGVLVGVGVFVLAGSVTRNAILVLRRTPITFPVMLQVPGSDPCGTVMSDVARPLLAIVSVFRTVYEDCPCRAHWISTRSLAAKPYR
jgi:hypothetical protein